MLVRHLALVLAATALVVAIAARDAHAAGGAAGGGGGVGARSAGSEPTGSRAYEKIAAKKHERGARYLKKGLAIEKKAAEAEDPPRRDELLGRAHDEYRRALRLFDSAISRQSDFHLAHSDRGFALRKLGDYEAALAAYDRALAIERDFAPAIEYRGEAYLELGRLDDAKRAYLALTSNEQALANLLLGKMQAWLARRSDDPGRLDPAALADFAAWVAERSRTADALPQPDPPETDAGAWRW